MTFLPNIPNAGDLLSFSQGQLKTNNQGLDAIFGIDHFPFSNATANKGYHAITHWPTQTVPTSNASYAQMFGFQPTANVGLIQYSMRGFATQIASPVTYLESPATPIVMASTATSNILDFTGIATAICMVYITNFNTTDVGNQLNSLSLVSWIGAPTNTFRISPIITAQVLNVTKFSLQQSSNILQILNGSSTMNNIAWTLQFLRIT